MARSELDSGVKRPLLPLSISQIGLIGGSGMINGLIACDTPHIIKGRIVKVIRTESEEKFSAQGNHIGSEVKETNTCESDARANEEALRSGNRIISWYQVSKELRIMIITEADRSATTILLPGEY